MEARGVWEASLVQSQEALHGYCYGGIQDQQKREGSGVLPVCWSSVLFSSSSSSSSSSSLATSKPNSSWMRSTVSSWIPKNLWLCWCVNTFVIYLMMTHWLIMSYQSLNPVLVQDEASKLWWYAKPKQLRTKQASTRASYWCLMVCKISCCHDLFTKQEEDFGLKLPPHYRFLQAPPSDLFRLLDWKPTAIKTKILGTTKF